VGEPRGRIEANGALVPFVTLSPPTYWRPLS